MHRCWLGIILDRVCAVVQSTVCWTSECGSLQIDDWDKTSWRDWQNHSWCMGWQRLLFVR